MNIIRNFTDVKSLLLGNKTVKQTIFKNTFWLAVAEVFTKGIGFLIVIWLARHFGPTIYGKWAFALSFVALFTVFADFGFNTLTVREIARDKSKTSQYIDNIVAMKLILGLITLGLIASVIQFLDKEPEVIKLVYFLGIYTVINTFAIFFQSIFRANEKMQYETICRVVQSFSLLGLVAFFILNKGSILTISYAYLGAALIGTLISLGAIWRYFSKFFLKIDLKVCKEIFSQAWPFGLSFLALNIYYNLSSVLLGIMRSDKEVGWYNAGYRIIIFITPLTGILFYSFLPIMARFFKKNLEKFKNICNKYASVMFQLGLPLSSGGVVVAPELISFIYEKPYHNAILPFQILVWHMGMIFIASPYSNSLLACDKQREYLKAVSIGVVFNIISNLILIPEYGMIGAAITAFLTEIVIFFKAYFEFSKIIKIDFLKNFLPPLISTVLMVVFLILLKKMGFYNPILLIFSGGLVYFLVFYFYEKYKSI